jgi:hypothetical protein
MARWQDGKLAKLAQATAVSMRGLLREVELRKRPSKVAQERQKGGGSAKWS